jgi:hypothetical protein
MSRKDMHELWTNNSNCQKREDGWRTAVSTRADKWISTQDTLNQILAVTEGEILWRIDASKRPFAPGIGVSRKKELQMCVVVGLNRRAGN